MTREQLDLYNKLITYLIAQGSGYKFCLNKQTYQVALPNLALRKADKIAISKYFKQQVMAKSISVDFDYIYSMCSRCGYKDSQNHIHYITI